MSGRWNYSQNDMNTFLVDFIDDKEVINTFPDLHKIVKRTTLTLIKIFDDIISYATCLLVASEINTEHHVRLETPFSR